MTSHAPAAPFVSAGAADRTISRPLIPRARGTHRAQWNIAATAVIWATSLFVAALWVAGGGVQSLLAGGGETLTTLGRITGLVSANLLLYQVLLMARVPLFERGFGRDAITRMHRWVGFWSFWLLLAHIVLLVLGYAVTAGVNPLAQAWDFVWNYPGMLLATAGTALLVDGCGLPDVPARDRLLVDAVGARRDRACTATSLPLLDACASLKPLSTHARAKTAPRVHPGRSRGRDERGP